jgi:hypothetical protein
LEETIEWNIRIDNHMQNIQYVSIRVKLINATQASPETNSPRNTEIIYEERKFLQIDESLTLPFNWYISETTDEDTKTVITGVNINSDNIKTNIIGEKGSGYRFVVELWSYDPSQKDFVFSYPSESIRESVWNQIWFTLA